MGIFRYISSLPAHRSLAGAICLLVASVVSSAGAAASRPYGCCLLLLLLSAFFRRSATGGGVDKGVAEKCRGVRINDRGEE